MLLRYDPFRELDRLADQVGKQARSVMAFDAVRTDEAVTIYFDVPGVRSDDLDITIERNELTVRADRRWDDSGQTIITQERPQGTFSRRIVLGDVLDTDRLEARLEDGVLIVTLPISDTSKQRKIQVKNERSSQPIDTTEA